MLNTYAYHVYIDLLLSSYAIAVCPSALKFSNKQNGVNMMSHAVKPVNPKNLRWARIVLARILAVPFLTSDKNDIKSCLDSWHKIMSANQLDISLAL